ncbi:MAG: FAD-binding oxidoreductase, partial [Actinomycetota bacterium]|nr:FAD-binding oxidoreductase [Actinomycetota bacterium]
MASLWTDRAAGSIRGPVTPGGRYDVVVAGAGLTGLVTALLLARGGLRVAVLEARRVGAGTTGHTTAKLSLLQGTRLSRIARKQPQEMVQAYVDANNEGQSWLLRYCSTHRVDVQRRPAVTYATTEQGRRSLDSELEAARGCGLDVELVDSVDLPYPTLGALRMDQQAQFDPMEVLTALVADLERHDGSVFEQTRVQGVHHGDPLRVGTGHGDILADRLVLATGTPVLDRGLYFARLEPLRSYALAFEVPETAPLPAGMYLSADPPSRSVRTAPHGDGVRLLVGGNGHVVGRHGSTRALVEDLQTWTAQHFPGARMTHSWSAQDYESIDALPYVGPLTPRNDRVLVATGYAKWGMTNAVAAGLALSGRILGSAAPWAQAMDSWRLREAAAAST